MKFHADFEMQFSIILCSGETIESPLTDIKCADGSIMASTKSRKLLRNISCFLHVLLYLSECCRAEYFSVEWNWLQVVFKYAYGG